MADRLSDEQARSPENELEIFGVVDASRREMVPGVSMRARPPPAPNPLVEPLPADETVAKIEAPFRLHRSTGSTVVDRPAQVPRVEPGLSGQGEVRMLAEPHGIGQRTGGAGSARLEAMASSAKCLRRRNAHGITRPMIERIRSCAMADRLTGGGRASHAVERTGRRMFGVRTSAVAVSGKAGKAAESVHVRQPTEKLADTGIGRGARPPAQQAMPDLD